MKKLQKTSEILWLFGVIFVALGVAICSKANLGVSMIASPSFVLSEILLKWSSIFSVGVTEYVFEGFLLLLLCVIVRRFNWQYLLSFAVAVIYGYVLNFFLWLLGGIEFDAVWLRWVMLIVGDTITAFGVACFFRTYLPLQVYELFVSEFSKRFNFKISKVKWGFDISLLGISVMLAVVLFGDVGAFDWSTIGYSSFHSIGLGTIVTTAINSPIINLMGRLIDKVSDNTPRFGGLEKFLKRE